MSCSSCCDGVHSTTAVAPPHLLPLIRGRYRRTCTSLLRYKVSFHLLTEVTGFPCIQHRGKRTHWGWIDYLRGGCSLTTQHREGWQDVGVFCFLFFFLSRPYLAIKKKKLSIRFSRGYFSLWNTVLRYKIWHYWMSKIDFILIAKK